MSRIDALTAEQEDQLVLWRNRWLCAGRSTEPANRSECERVWQEMYAQLGRPRPAVLWWDGQFSCAIATELFQENLGSNLRSNLGSNLWAHLGDNLGSNLRSNLRSNLGSNLCYFWGQHESHWCAYYAFPHLHIRSMHTSEQMKKLNWWLTLSENTGWWHPYENAVMACERLAKQDVDEQGRLHCDDGPAAVWRDGWEVFAWHGVRINRRIIESPEKITPKQIVEEQNAEVRRVMLYKYGLDRFLQSPYVTQIQSDGYGDLYEFNLGDDVEKFVKVINGTPEPDGTYKDYIIPTWADVTTAREAVARSYGMQKNEYAPVFRT